MSEIQPNISTNNEAKSLGFATASMVLGIIGIVLFWTGWIGLILDILAIIFGGITLNKAKTENITNKGSGKAGLIMGIIGVVLDLAVLLVFASLIASFASLPK